MTRYVHPTGISVSDYPISAPVVRFPDMYLPRVGPRPSLPPNVRPIITNPGRSIDWMSIRKRLPRSR